MATSSVFDLRSTSVIKPDGTFGLTGKPIQGVRVVLEQCACAITTRRGSLIHSRGEGEDIRELENGDFSPTELEQRRTAYERQMRSVDFVVGVKSRLRINAERKAIFEADIAIRDAGTYPLSVTAEQAGKVISDLRGVS